jgi:four helix bundle protein
LGVRMLKNKNRGYQQLRVWQDAVRFYKLNTYVFGSFPYSLRRIASQALASSDSVHRNIAEGYCRRSIREYIAFLYIALGSLGECVSGFHAYLEAGQLAEKDFAGLNELSFKLENSLLKLVESLERKKFDGAWVDSLVVKESNDNYGAEMSEGPLLHHSNTPILQR